MVRGCGVSGFLEFVLPVLSSPSAASAPAVKGGHRYRELGLFYQCSRLGVLGLEFRV